MLFCRDGEDLLELIAGMQSKRMDEQRVTLPYLPGLNTNQDADDSFIEMLVKCQVCAETIALSHTEARCATPTEKKIPNAKHCEF